MSINLGSIGAGVQKGLQYDVQFSRNIIWAAKTSNASAMKDLVAIAEKNVEEIVGTGSDVTQSHAVALLFAGDPFSGSRQMMHDFEAKYGKH